MEYNYEELKQKYISFLYENNLDEVDIAIHCDIEEKAKILINVYALLGKRWKETSPLLIPSENYRPVTRWSGNGPQTCYRINENDRSRVSTSREQFYRDKKVMVLEFNDIFNIVIEEKTDDNTTSKQNKKTNKGIISGVFRKKHNDSDENTDVQTVDNISNVQVPEKQVQNPVNNTVLVVAANETAPDFEEKEPVTEVISAPTPDVVSEDVIIKKEEIIDEEIPNIIEIDANGNVKDVVNSELTADDQTSPDMPNDIVTSPFSLNNDEKEQKNENIQDNSIKNKTLQASSSNINTNIQRDNPESFKEYTFKDNDIKEELNVDIKDNRFNNNSTAKKNDERENNSPQPKKIGVPIEKMRPFVVESELFDNRTFRLNQCGIREELKEKKFWVPCDCEWELSYIMFNYKKIKYL